MDSAPPEDPDLDRVHEWLFDRLRTRGEDGRVVDLDLAAGLLAAMVARAGGEEGKPKDSDPKPDSQDPGRERPSGPIPCS